MAETRHQFLWAIVKGLGIYFLARGVLGFIPTLILLLGEHPILRSGIVWDSPNPWIFLFAHFLEGSIGAYMLLDGKWLIRLANRSGIPDAPAAEDAGDENSGAADC